MQAGRRNVDGQAGERRWRRWREEDARAALEAAAKSGLRPSEFAERAGIHPRRLTRWRKRLGVGVGTGRQEVGGTGGRGEPVGVRLIPAVAVNRSRGMVGGAAVVVRLAEGVVLEMGDVTTVPPQWVAGLVDSLRRSR